MDEVELQRQKPFIGPQTVSKVFISFTLEKHQWFFSSNIHHLLFIILYPEKLCERYCACGCTNQYPAIDDVQCNRILGGRAETPLMRPPTGNKVPISGLCLRWLQCCYTREKTIVFL